jgi:hypothetical protein
MPKMKVKETHRNDDLGQNEATMTVTNDAVLFLKEAVAMYIQRDFGDKDDPKQNKIRQEVKQDLHEAWKALNPS